MLTTLKLIQQLPKSAPKQKVVNGFIQLQWTTKWGLQLFPYNSNNNFSSQSRHCFMFCKWTVPCMVYLHPHSQPVARVRSGICRGHITPDRASGSCDCYPVMWNRSTLHALRHLAPIKPHNWKLKMIVAVLVSKSERLNKSVPATINIFHLNSR